MSDGGWSFGGSILTFVFPILLFIGVAIYLYILYTKPTVVPGHRTSPVERPVSHTAVPGIAAADQVGENLHGRAPVEPVADDDDAAGDAGLGGADDPGGPDGEHQAPQVEE